MTRFITVAIRIIYVLVTLSHHCVQIAGKISLKKVFALVHNPSGKDIMVTGEESHSYRLESRATKQELGLGCNP